MMLQNINQILYRKEHPVCTVIARDKSCCYQVRPLVHCPLCLEGAPRCLKLRYFIELAPPKKLELTLNKCCMQSVGCMHCVMALPETW